MTGQHLGRHHEWLAYLALAGLFHLLIALRHEWARLFSTPLTGYVTLAFSFGALCGYLSLSADTRTRLTLPLLRPIWIVGRRASRAFRVASSHGRIIVVALGIIAVVLGITWRMAVYLDVPIDPRRADMLPLIGRACEALAAGQYPYRYYEVPFRLPLTFLPALWLPYMPACLLNVDLRHTGLVASAVIAVLFVLLSLRPARNDLAQFPDDARFLAVPIAALLALILFMFSPEIIAFSAIAHTPPFWMYLAFFCFFLLRGKDAAASVFFGLVLCSRQTSILFLPAMVAYWWRSHGARCAAGRMAISIAVWVAIAGPFLALDWRAFLIDPLAHYEMVSSWDFTRGPKSFMYSTIGFSYWLRSLWGADALLFLRGVVIVVIVLLAALRVRDRTSLFTAMAVASMLFGLFTPIPFHYIYFAPLLLLTFAGISAAQQADLAGAVSAAARTALHTGRRSQELRPHADL